MCIRLGNIDNHLKFKIAYGGYNDIDNEVEHQLEITVITPVGNTCQLAHVELMV